MNTKKCTKCNVEYNINDFRLMGIKLYPNRRRTMCNGCDNKRKRDERKKKYPTGYFQQKAFEYMGKRCTNPNCPLDQTREYPTSIYDYHHIDKNSKTKDVSILINASNPTWTSIKGELDKCIVLCCVCHRMLHDGLWELAQKINIEKQL